MFERPRTGERAVLVHLELSTEDSREDPEELHALVESAGATPVAEVCGRRDAPDAHFFVGQGKADEIAERARETAAEVVIFNHPLSPAQERNLEAHLRCRVLDRIGLILDIFAQRASSFEGKLQVELAQLKHLSTRLVRGWSHLERQKGGIGLRGPGEKQLESDRRLVADRIRQINRRLDRVARRRELSRRSRRKASVPVVSLVGYTNAGKSTLFNQVTGAGVLMADQLFATLDTTLRRLELPGAGALVLADTVGFIRHLPHELVAAFRATLEETRNARLLLHVIDAGTPDRSARREQVNDVLEEIGANEVPQIEVYNKADAVPGAVPRVERGPDGLINRVWLSARTGEGTDLLLEALAEHLHPDRGRHRVTLPAGDGRLRARLFELGRVLDERAGAEGEWVMDVEAGRERLEAFCGREGLALERLDARAEPGEEATAAEYVEAEPQ